jgi:hypothetical protein
VKERKMHGLSQTRLYRIWALIKDRCFNHNTTCYVNYGGRGIGICNEWLDFETFYYWSLKNGYSDLLTIDRKDNDGNYTPSNCRWVDRKTQQNNMRANHKIVYKGELLNMSQIIEITGFNRNTVNGRIRLGWQDKDLFIPVHRYREAN